MGGNYQWQEKIQYTHQRWIQKQTSKWMLGLVKQTQDKIKTVSKTHPPQPTYRSKIKVIHMSWMYIARCLMVIHPCVKFGMPMSKSKDDLTQTQIHGENIISILRPKVLCQIWYEFVKGQKSCGPNTKLCQKPYKFDLEVKGQHCIRIMNVCHTSFHGDRSMCQIWYANVKENRSYGLDTKTCQKS